MYPSLHLCLPAIENDVFRLPSTMITYLYHTGIMKTQYHISFLKKYVSIYFTKVVDICVRVRERQGEEGFGQRLVEDCYIDLSLTHVVLPYSGPIICFLAGGSHCLQPWIAPNASSVFTWFCANWLTDHDSSWLCDEDIYNFITPTRSSGPWFRWSASAYQPTNAVILFSLWEHPVPKSLIDGSFQRSICNIESCPGRRTLGVLFNFYLV